MIVLSRRPTRRRVGLLTALATLASALLWAPGAAGAAGITVHQSTKITVARGVQRWSVSWTNAAGYQHGFVMSVNLTVRGVHVKPGVGFGSLNIPQSTLGIAHRVGAIAAVNGDFFDWGTLVPWGGVAVDGRVLKTPRPDRPSQFYVTRAGRVGIGPLVWTASATTVSSTGAPALTHRLAAVNGLGAADAGFLTMITPAMTSESLRGCPAVEGTVRNQVLTVSTVDTKLWRFRRLTGAERILAACGASGRWLLANAPLHQQLRIRTSLRTQNGAVVESFISGERALRLNGQAYHDKTGAGTSGLNPETAACVSRDGEHVLLIVVDGWLQWASAGDGVTLPQLGTLAAALHCYSTVVFDGGGSSTMVARRAGTLHVLNKLPQLYGQRPIPDALLVFT